jgi:hypothetical protein
MGEFLQKYDDSYHGVNHCARENESRGIRIFLQFIVEKNYYSERQKKVGIV